jgi:hypothetical protein
LKAATKLTETITTKGEVLIEDHFRSIQSNVNGETDIRKKRMVDASEKQKQIWDKQVKTIFTTRAQNNFKRRFKTIDRE